LTNPLPGRPGAPAVADSTLTGQAASGVLWNGAATVVNALLQLVTLAVLARALEPESFGLMSMAVLVTGLGSVLAEAGVGNAIIHRQDATRHELSSLYWFTVVLGVAAFLLIQAVTPAVVAFFGEDALAPILRWVAVAVLIAPLGQQFQSLLRRDLRFRTLAAVRVIETVVYTTVAISLAIAGSGVMSLVYAHVARVVVSTLALIAIAIRSQLLPRLHFRLKELDRFLRFGLFQTGEGVANYLGSNVDYIIVGTLLGPVALGYYTLAFTFVLLPLTYINPVVTAVAFPAFSRVQTDDARLRRGYLKVIRYITGASFPVMAFIGAAAPIAVPLIYGPQWMPAVPVVQILALLGALKSLANPAGSVFLAKGRSDWSFYLNVVTLAGYGISNYIGAYWGLGGVAWSSVLFAGLLLPVSIRLGWKLIELPMADYLRSFAVPAAASVLLALAVLAARGLLEGTLSPIPELAALGAAGALVYATALWLLDRDLLRELSRDLLSGLKRKAVT
jgi:lipopolysaccharide exporter